MLRTLSLVGAVAMSIIAPAAADSITNVNGPAVTSINEGAVTASGSFGKASITGGRSNFIGVAATGAGVNIQILKDGVGETGASGDTIGVSSINAQNKASGTVTANGTFGGSLVSSTGSGNGVSVSAAGTSVNLSIVKR